MGFTLRPCGMATRLGDLSRWHIQGNRIHYPLSFRGVKFYFSTVLFLSFPGLIFIESQSFLRVPSARFFLARLPSTARLSLCACSSRNQLKLHF